jgi:long-chain acyl-CoA synthetase
MEWVDLMNSIKEADTFPKLLKRNFERFGDRQTALALKDYGIWQPYTWKDYYEKVKYFFMGIRNLGLEAGDKVSILGETKPESYFAQLAVQAMRGTVVGIFTDCLPEEVKYFVKHSDSKFVVAHDQEQVDKVLDIKNDTPLLKKIIYWDPKGLWNYEDEMLISFEEVINIGKKYAESYPDSFEEMIEEGNEEDVALFCYSSGTTGDPKGIMITHKTILASGAAWACLDDWCETDHYVSFLPLAWVTEQMMIAASLITGLVVNFTESIETVQEDIRETGPSVLFWGARNWESINRLIQAKITDSTFLNRFLYDAFLKVGYIVADMDTEGKEIPFFWKLLNKIGYWAVFRDLLDRVGLSKARNAYTGGAPISPDVVRFFKAMGVNIRVAYGSSEIALASVHRANDVKPGTSGPPLPHMEIKISEEGEILAKTKYTLKGYYKDPDGLAKKITDDWYHTGDFGHITEDGHLVVMDRLDDLRLLSNGTKFSPQYIESRLRFSPYIKDVLITGGKERDYVGAIVNIDLDNVGRWAEARKIAYTTYTDLSQKPEVIELINGAFVRVNSLLPKNSRVKKFLTLHKEFDADDAELTRTRKIKREFMENRYEELINGLYKDIEEIVIEAPVTYRDGRKGTIKTAIQINKTD